MNPPRCLDRRTFLAAFLLAGCGSNSPRRTPASAHPAPPLPPTWAPQPPAPLGHGPGAICAPTLDNIEGPFFKPGAPERSVLANGGPGLMRVSGVVRDAACRPIAGARMQFWQADHHGAYDNVGFGFRASLRTDALGRYAIDTIVPGHYLNGDRYRPAHIHVKVAANGFAPLTTQLYFSGDAYNEGDAFFRPELLLSAGGAFDFALRA